MREVPIVNMMLIVKSGGAADPAGKFGLANYTAAMLDEGAGARDALALADAVDFLGASLGTTSSFDASTVSLRSLVSTFDQALPIFADVQQAGRIGRGSAVHPVDAGSARQRRSELPPVEGGSH